MIIFFNSLGDASNACLLPENSIDCLATIEYWPNSSVRIWHKWILWLLISSPIMPRLEPAFADVEDFLLNLDKIVMFLIAVTARVQTIYIVQELAKNQYFQVFIH